MTTTPASDFHEAPCATCDTRHTIGNLDSNGRCRACVRRSAECDGCGAVECCCEAFQRCVECGRLGNRTTGLCGECEVTT